MLLSTSGVGKPVGADGLSHIENSLTPDVSFSLSPVVVSEKPFVSRDAMSNLETSVSIPAVAPVVDTTAGVSLLSKTLPELMSKSCPLVRPR